MINIKRIHLLSETEITDLYAHPEFSNDEQKLYFTLSKHEQAALARYVNTKTRVYFILQLGYFKAKQQFFKFDFAAVNDDAEFILNAYFNDAKSLSGCLSRDSLRTQKQEILALFDYREWSPTYEPQVESHLCKLLRYYPKAHNALRQLLGYFDNQKIIIPTYRTLQDLFTTAFSTEEQRLNQLILSIPRTQQAQLSALVKQKRGINSQRDSISSFYIAILSMSKTIPHPNKVANKHHYIRYF